MNDTSYTRITTSTLQGVTFEEEYKAMPCLGDIEGHVDWDNEMHFVHPVQGGKPTLPHPRTMSISPYVNAAHFRSARKASKMFK